jgi:2-phosphosulfolactate phosphatase
VVIDIFRATSSICYGIENGATEIVPVASVDECKSYEGQGYLLAAERNGEVVNGFHFGNSPFSYTKEKVAQKKVVLTTTNGTHAIQQAKAADKIIIGSFLNLDSLCEWLAKQNQDVLLLCSGWKNKFNLEDTLFAGAVVHKLKNNFNHYCDAAIAAEDMYLLAKENLREYLYKSSHSQRLKELNIEDDIQFCLKQNICKTIPVLEEGKLVAMVI